MAVRELDGALFAELFRAGALHLRANAKIVNDLNVFPIPDGDTGENMGLTAEGGEAALERMAERELSPSLGDAANACARGMLMGARGNSGVIFSQLVAGMAKALSGTEKADTEALANAVAAGIKTAYEAVMEPTEGTILTVAREAAAAANAANPATVEEFAEIWLAEAKRSLARTPELLACLKEAGVVDSGGAGLCYFGEGILRALRGEKPAAEVAPAPTAGAPEEPDYDLFTEDSVMEFGYCTEFLLRLQRIKCDPDSFDLDALIAYLGTVGNSVVAFRTGTVVKVHVHTMRPGDVLSYCQRYGEYLKLKIENMTLQHNGVLETKPEEPKRAARKPYGVVVVAEGEGIVKTFRDLGADVVVPGGQTKNPSAEELLRACEETNADTVLLFPNNGNIRLAAHQAAEMCTSADVRVIGSGTIGDGYAALTMLDTDSGDTDEIVRSLEEAMEGVLTGSVTHAIRDVTLSGIKIHDGDYIGLCGKEVLSDAPDPMLAAERLVEKWDFSTHEVLILIVGRDVTTADADALNRRLGAKLPGVEIYQIDGGQDVYDFILIAE